MAERTDIRSIKIASSTLEIIIPNIEMVVCFW